MMPSDKMLGKEVVPFAAQLYVTDFVKSTEFYRKVLGFNVIRNHPNRMFMVLSFYDSILMINSESGRRLGDGSGIQLRFIIPEIGEDLKVYHDKVKSKGAEITQKITQRTYGLTTFIVKDPNGFELKFCTRT